MVPALRRRHRQIWLFLAVVLPVAYAAAILTLRPPVRTGRLVPDLPAPVATGADEAGFRATVLDLPDGTGRRLEVEVVRPLTVPAAVVFLEAGGSRRALGQLETVGVYHFPLGSVASGATVSIVDPLNDSRLLTTQIQ